MEIDQAKAKSMIYSTKSMLWFEQYRIMAFVRFTPIVCLTVSVYLFNRKIHYSSCLFSSLRLWSSFFLQDSLFIDSFTNVLFRTLVVLFYSPLYSFYYAFYFSLLQLLPVTKSCQLSFFCMANHSNGIVEIHMMALY